MGLQRIQPIDSPWHIEMGEAKKVFSCSIGASNLPFFLGGWLCRSWTRCQTFSSSFWSSSSWLVLKKKRPMVKQLELLLLQPPERRDWIGTINPRSSRDLHYGFIHFAHSSFSEPFCFKESLLGMHPWKNNLVHFIKIKEGISFLETQRWMKQIFTVICNKQVDIYMSLFQTWLTCR